MSVQDLIDELSKLDPYREVLIRANVEEAGDCTLKVDRVISVPQPTIEAHE